MADSQSSTSVSADTPAPTPFDRLTTALPWIARLAWLGVAAIGGAAVESAVDERSGAVRWVSAVGAWGAFAAVAVALLIPSVLSLTVARVMGPLALAAGIAAAIGGAPALDLALLLIPAVIAVAATFSAEMGRTMVQASAYGDEHRLPLRCPAAIGAAAVITWIAWAGALIGGPLLVAADNLAAGIPVSILAVAITALVGPRWHRISRRWLVLVPAGLVVHDPVVLADTVMVRTDQLVAVGLAPADTQAADLTGPASGYAIQVDTSETVTSVFAFTPSEPDGKAIHMTAFLVAPSRPGEALRLAAQRRLPVR